MQRSMGSTRAFACSGRRLADRFGRRNHVRVVNWPQHLWLARAPTTAREACALPLHRSSWGQVIETSMQCLTGSIP